MIRQAPVSLRRLLAPCSVTLVVLAVLAAALYRLPYGVDLQDEPMHLASSHRFAHGAQPYVDELLSSPQNAAVLLAPAVRLYEAVEGREGIVLFSRRLYLLFTIAAAAALAWGLSAFASWKAATLSSLAAVAFVPFGLPEFHQNTLALPFFAIGCVLGLSAGVARRQARARAVVGGLAHGLAVFVYPFLLPAVLAFAVGLFLLRREWSPSPLRLYAPAACVPLAGLVLLGLAAGVGNVQAAYEYAVDYVGQGGGLGKVAETLRYRSAAFPNKALAALVVGAILVLHWRRPRLAPLLLVLLPLVPLARGELETSVGSSDYLVNVGLLGAVAAVLAWRDREARLLFLALWLPALVAGFAVSWASSNDGQNFAIGFFPGVLATLLLTGTLLQRAFGQRVRRVPAGIAGVLPALVVVAVLMAFTYSSVYRDEPIRELDAVIPAGPYEGTVTTQAKRRYIVRLEDDLRRAASADETIAVFDALPLAYLLSPSRPLTNTAWSLDVPDQPAYRRLVLDYYERRGELPDIVLRVRRVPLARKETVVLEYGPDDPLDRFLATHRYERVLQKPEYTIFRRRAQPSTP